MNWTAIVVLLIANAFLGYLVWCAEERASSSYLGAREAKNEARFALEEMHKAQIAEQVTLLKLDTERRLHQRLLAKNQRKRDGLDRQPSQVVKARLGTAVERAPLILDDESADTRASSLTTQEKQP